MTSRPDEGLAGGPLVVRWLSVFADVPAESIEAALRYWQHVSGHPVGEPQGRRGEFIPLVPVEADRFVWLQPVGRPDGGWHLELHVDDVAAATAVAVALGARIERADHELATLVSPAGQRFCLVEESASGRRTQEPTLWPGGQRSVLDQICFDIPADRFDEECDFWSVLTGWPRTHGDLGEFDRLTVPAGLPVRVLLQSLGEDDTGGTRAHLDMGSDDRAAETDRHVALGGVVINPAEHWTTLRDPAGLVYCITDRRPGRR
ncbi:MAG: hypothetical protein QOH52_4397 [Pseudonocardiales bacterium]|nr:hypothetical protein [Pseudonocardiales bacterium]